MVVIYPETHRGLLCFPPIFMAKIFFCGCISTNGNHVTITFVTTGHGGTKQVISVELHIPAQVEASLYPSIPSVAGPHQRGLHHLRADAEGPPLLHDARRARGGGRKSTRPRRCRRGQGGATARRAGLTTIIKNFCYHFIYLFIDSSTVYYSHS